MTSCSVSSDPGQGVVLGEVARYQERQRGNQTASEPAGRSAQQGLLGADYDQRDLRQAPLALFSGGRPSTSTRRTFAHASVYRRRAAS
jgi:hypothetical protein